MVSKPPQDIASRKELHKKKTKKTPPRHWSGYLRLLRRLQGTICLRAAARGTHRHLNAGQPWFHSRLQQTNSTGRRLLPVNADGKEEAALHLTTKPCNVPRPPLLGSDPAAGGAERSTAFPRAPAPPPPFLYRHGGPGRAQRPQRRGGLWRLLGAGCQHEGGVRGGDEGAPGLLAPGGSAAAPAAAPVPPRSLSRWADVRRMAGGMEPARVPVSGRERAGGCSASFMRGDRPGGRGAARRRPARLGFAIVMKGGPVGPAAVSPRPALPRGPASRGALGRVGASAGARSGWS